jgi:hypothetical protein
MNTLISSKNVLAASIVCLLTLGVSCAASAQDALVIRGVYKPGRLESFLIANPGATLTKQKLGEFAAPTTATFTAIVVSDPVTKAKLSGLEVRFRGADQVTVYLDDDSVKRLRGAVTSLQQSQLFDEEHRGEKSPADLAITRVTSVYNDYTKWVRPDGQTETAGILHVGYYWHEGGFGVYLAPVWGVNHQSAELRYPTASLTDLSQILLATSAFLNSN